MNLIKGFKKETMESFANLWENKDFKELVRILRDNQHNCAIKCLTRNKMEDIVSLQEEARAYSLIIQMVEGAYKKVNNLPKRRK